VYPDIAPIVLDTKPNTEAIYGWNFSNLKARLIRDRVVKDENEAGEAIHEYLRYMELTVRYPHLRLPMSHPVDPVWHTHLLFTHDYAAFCQAIAGRFIHHCPALSKEDEEAMTARYLARTVALYDQHFGIAPDKWWPTNGACCKCSSCSG